MTIPVQVRKGTAAEWAANGSRVFALGELLLETDTLKLKAGDGASAYTALPYLSTGGGGGGSTTYAALTDASNADLPGLNSPLSIALGLLAPKASPALTGTPTVPTAAAGTNTTQAASMAALQAERSNPATLIGKTMSGASNTFSQLPAAGLSGVVPPANLGSGTASSTTVLFGDSTYKTIPGGGDALTTGNLSQFALTTSSQFAGRITDPTGTGAVVLAASPALTGTPTVPTAAAGTNTTQAASMAALFAERTNPATETNKTFTAPVVNAPAFGGVATGSMTLPSTVTMAASPSQGDNSLKITTTAYADTAANAKVANDLIASTTVAPSKTAVNTALALKVDSLPGVVLGTGANTLTEAAHANRHLSWPGTTTAAQTLPATSTSGNFFEIENDGTAPFTVVNATAKPGYKLSAMPGELWQGVSDGTNIDSTLPRVNTARVTLTDAATVTIDADLSSTYNVTLAGNRTLANPTNLQDGMYWCIWVKQDGTGSRTLAYGSKYKNAVALPVLSTAANAVDLLTFAYNSTLDVIYVSLGKVA